MPVFGSVFWVIYWNWTRVAEQTIGHLSEHKQGIRQSAKCCEYLKELWVPVKGGRTKSTYKMKVRDGSFCRMTI